MEGCPGAAVVGVSCPPGRAKGKRGWSPAFLDRTFVLAKRRGGAIGVTKRVEGSKVIRDSYRRPGGECSASGNSAVRVPCRRERSRTRPKNLVVEKAYESEAFRPRLRLVVRYERWGKACYTFALFAVTFICLDNLK
jgi:hypothetical protein